MLRAAASVQRSPSGGEIEVATTASLALVNARETVDVQPSVRVVHHAIPKLGPLPESLSRSVAIVGSFNVDGPDASGFRSYRSPNRQRKAREVVVVQQSHGGGLDVDAFVSPRVPLEEVPLQQYDGKGMIFKRRVIRRQKASNSPPNVEPQPPAGSGATIGHKRDSSTVLASQSELFAATGGPQRRSLAVDVKTPTQTAKANGSTVFTHPTPPSAPSSTSLKLQQLAELGMLSRRGYSRAEQAAERIVQKVSVDVTLKRTAPHATALAQCSWLVFCNAGVVCAVSHESRGAGVTA